MHFRKWNKHYELAKSRKQRPSLLKVLVSTFWPEYLILAIILVIMDLGVRLVQPKMLGKLLEYFKLQPEITKTEALW